MGVCATMGRWKVRLGSCDSQGWNIYSNSQTWSQKSPFLQGTCHLVHKAGNADIQEAFTDSNCSMSI